MSPSLLINNFIWPAVSYSLAFIGIITILIIEATESDKIHDQSIHGTIIRFVMAVFPIIGILSAILNGFVIEFKAPNFYNYLDQIATWFGTIFIIIFIIVVLLWAIPTFMLWIRWNGAHIIHYYVSNHKDLNELKRRYHYLKNHIANNMNPDEAYRPYGYSQSSYKPKQLLDFLEKLEKPLTNATSVNNFYKLVIEDDNLGKNSINTLEEIYNMPGIPENKQIFKNKFDLLTQQKIEDAIFYSQK